MWNYRILKKDKLYGLFEVYYDNGKAVSCTEEPISEWYDSREELIQAHGFMLKDAKNQTTLSYSRFT